MVMPSILLSLYHCGVCSRFLSSAFRAAERFVKASFISSVSRSYCSPS